MSIVSLNFSMSRVSTKTPFCGACQKAGKKPEEYNSHWTNTKGILTCPLILSSECGYCHQLGHWTKACPKLNNRASAGGGGRNSASDMGGGWSFSKKSANKYCVSDDSNKKPASSSTSNQKNLFSNLLEDSDTESESDSDELESTPVPIKVVQRCTPLKISIRPADETSTKLSVTISNDAPMERPILNVHRYNYFDKPHGRLMDWTEFCSDSDDE